MKSIGEFLSRLRTKKAVADSARESVEREPQPTPLLSCSNLRIPKNRVCRARAKRSLATKRMLVSPSVRPQAIARLGAVHGSASRRTSKRAQQFHRRRPCRQ